MEKKCLRGPQKWVRSALISHKTPISTIFFKFLMMTQATQSHRAGYVFETPVLQCGQRMQQVSTLTAEKISQLPDPPCERDTQSKYAKKSLSKDN